MRLLGVLAVAAMAWFTAPSSSDQPAAASCVAPTATFRPARVARGGVLTITGQHFGDDCLDTGTLPPGVGPLGSPLTGLAIVINQGDREFLVATGSADSDYAFRVEIVVPPELEPGEAVVSVMGAGDARMILSPALVVSNASPVSSAEPTAATFGPQPTTDTQPPGSLPPIVLPAEIPDEPAATSPPLSTTPIDPDTGNSDLQRAIAVGVAGVIAIAATAFAVWARAKRRGM